MEGVHRDLFGDQEKLRARLTELGIMTEGMTLAGMENQARDINESVIEKAARSVDELRRTFSVEEGPALKRSSTTYFNLPNLPTLIDHPEEERREVLPRVSTGLTTLNLSYDGTGDVYDFIDRIAVLKAARRLDESLLVGSFVDLLKGAAYTWYRPYMGKFRSWDSLRAALIERFGNEEREDAIMDELRARMQAADESIRGYVDEMRAIASKLETAMPDKRLFKFVVRGLRRDYMPTVAVVPEGDLIKLTYEGRRFERMTAENVASREADLSQSKVEKAEPNEGRRRTWRPAAQNQVAAVGASRPLGCYGCGSVDHMRRDCRNRRGIRCFGCGAPGVVRKQCGKCNAKGEGPAVKQNPKNV